MSKTLTEIEKILNLPDPMLQFKWRAKTLPFDLPTEYMEGIDLPFNNIGVSEGVHVASRHYFYPGIHTVSQFQATFYEDRNGRAHAWIENWKKKVKNFETGVYQLPSAYKQKMEVQMLDQKNNAILTATIIGCWPADTQPIQLNYTDGSGRVTLQQTFSCDEVRHVFHRSFG